MPRLRAVRPGIITQGSQVFDGSVSRDLTTGSNNESGSGLEMTLGNRVGHVYLGSISQHRYWVKITQQHLACAHLVPSFGKRSQGIKVDDFTTQAAHWF